jgi:hypothetical protein
VKDAPAEETAVSTTETQRPRREQRRRERERQEEEKDFHRPHGEEDSKDWKRTLFASESV